MFVPVSVFHGTEKNPVVFATAIIELVMWGEEAVGTTLHYFTLLQTKGLFHCVEPSPPHNYRTDQLSVIVQLYMNIWTVLFSCAAVFIRHIQFTLEFCWKLYLKIPSIISRAKGHVFLWHTFFWTAVQNENSSSSQRSPHTGVSAAGCQ